MRQMWKTWLAVTISILASAVVVLSYSTQAGSYAAEAPKEIGFIGDSITIGPKNTPNNAVTAEMNALGDGYIAINRGVSGMATKDWVPGKDLFDKSLDVFKARNVRVVSIMLGTNDARPNIQESPDSYENNMRKIVAELLESGTVRRVIINYPPYIAVKDNEKRIALLKEYAARLDTITQLPGVVKGDTGAYDYFQQNTSQLADGVHPTPEGYKALGELWAEAFKRSVARPKTLVAFTPLPAR